MDTKIKNCFFYVDFYNLKIGLDLRIFAYNNSIKI